LDEELRCYMHNWVVTAVDHKRRPRKWGTMGIARPMRPTSLQNHLTPEATQSETPEHGLQQAPATWMSGDGRGYGPSEKPSEAPALREG
jgi:hypothetical protein